ncbi:hypothetical protein FOXYSP1_17490 [Fusarium oxysporum f. sp. phaseoli]
MGGQVSRNTIPSMKGSRQVTSGMFA